MWECLNALTADLSKHKMYGAFLSQKYCTTMRNISKNTKFYTTTSHKTTASISLNNNKLVSFNRK